VDSSGNVIVTGIALKAGGSEYVTIKYSNVGVPLWTNRHSAQINQPAAMAVDRNDDVIVAGTSESSDGGFDYATIKYSSAGALLWTNRYNGSANDSDLASALAVDANNDVVVTGSSSGGGNNYPGYATVKYSSTGVPLWTNRYDGSANSQDKANAVAVDGSNNVVVTGTSTIIDNSFDWVTIQYSSAGVSLWTNRYNGLGRSVRGAYAIAVDRSNNVIVAGSSLDQDGRTNCLTIKYSSAGVPIWTKGYVGPAAGGDGACAVVVDSSNNVTIAGISATKTVYPFDYEYVTIQYSSAGVPVWTNRYNGRGIGDNRSRALALDGSNNVIVTGYSSVGYSGGYEYATIEYSSAGVPLWTNRFAPAGWNSRANAVAVDRKGSVFVTGKSGGGGAYYFATIKYLSSPPVLTALPLTNGNFQMRVDDMMYLRRLVIEASTNAEVWVPLATNAVLTNHLFFTDQAATNYLQRFYRTFYLP
jgi:hypothetical protein